MDLARGVRVDIFFADAAMEELCSTEKSARRALGRDGARKLVTRLADMRAARGVTELVAGHPEPLVGDRKGQVSVRLDGGRRLVFEPTDPVPRGDDKAIVWSKVTSVRIVFIGDYHD